MTYLWLADAVRTLTVGGNDIFGFQLWKIDISNMPLIYYAPLRIYKRGARRQTRKYTNLSNPMRDKIPRGDDYKLFDYSSSS